MRDTTLCEKLLPTGEDSCRIQQTALELVQLPIESIALSTHERSLWSQSDPPNNSHETPLPFPPVFPLPSPHPSCSHPFSPPTLSCLFLCLSCLFAFADCVPTFLRSLFVLSLSLPFVSTSAQSRVWVCAVVPRCFSPTTRLPLSPHWGHRVARYRSAISRIPASPRDAPISAMTARPEVLTKKASITGCLSSLWDNLSFICPYTTFFTGGIHFSCHLTAEWIFDTPTQDLNVR